MTGSESPHRHRPTGRGGATPRRPGCPIMAGTARNGDGPAGKKHAEAAAHGRQR